VIFKGSGNVTKSFGKFVEKQKIIDFSEINVFRWNVKVFCVLSESQK
jgi:hypothetical protein